MCAQKIQIHKKFSSSDQLIKSMPPLPDTVARVVEVTSCPDSSVRDLVKVIVPDQSMCLALLKIANSALYGRQKEIGSIDQAVVVLGFAEVESIVLGKAAVKSFQSVLGRNVEELNMFWLHSFTCGLAAKVIGEHYNLSPGQLFMSGLLHDIGKLLMLILMEEKYDAKKFLIGFSTAEKCGEEFAQYQTNHQILAGKLLRYWNFPNKLVDSILYHHAPEKVSEHQDYPLIIQLADFLAHMCEEEEKGHEIELMSNLTFFLPNIHDTWVSHYPPLDDISLELFYNWVKVDRENGSEILTILAG